MRPTHIFRRTDGRNVQPGREKPRAVTWFVGRCFPGQKDRSGYRRSNGNTKPAKTRLDLSVRAKQRGRRKESGGDPRSGGCEAAAIQSTKFNAAFLVLNVWKLGKV
jgi:hypothetical protein